MPINFANNVRVSPSELHEDKFQWRVFTEDGATFAQADNVDSEEQANSDALFVMLDLQSLDENRDWEGEQADHDYKCRDL